MWNDQDKICNLYFFLLSPILKLNSDTHFPPMKIKTAGNDPSSDQFFKWIITLYFVNVFKTIHSLTDCEAFINLDLRLTAVKFQYM